MYYGSICDVNVPCTMAVFVMLMFPVHGSICDVNVPCTMAVFVMLMFHVLWQYL